MTADVRRRSGRGRPPKFGRPSEVVALTLPEDVLAALRAVHHDPGWAIVRVVESTLGKSARNGPARAARALAELVHLPGRRALIVVQPRPFRRLRGVSTIPLSDGRAFLAFDHAGGLADLEVAILDALEAAPSGSGVRAQLAEIRSIVRGWRQQPRLAFRTRSIIVVEGTTGAPRRPLAALQDGVSKSRGSIRRSPRRPTRS